MEEARDLVLVGGRLVARLTDLLRSYDVDVVCPPYLREVLVVLVLKEVPGLGVALVELEVPTVVVIRADSEEPENPGVRWSDPIVPKAGGTRGVEDMIYSL